MNHMILITQGTDCMIVRCRSLEDALEKWHDFVRVAGVVRPTTLEMIEYRTLELLDGGK